MKPIYLFCCIVFLFGCSGKKYTNPHVLIHTQTGNIEVELYPEKAPITVAAFLSFIEKGYYKNASFYRVLNLDNQPSNAPKTELIQGGLWKTNYKQAAAIKGIPHESTLVTGIHHVNGTISLARQAPGTAGSEFFICIDDQPGLDYGGENISDKQGYAAFGKVVKGMEIVRSIYRSNEEDQYFSPPIFIMEIERL